MLYFQNIVADGKRTDPKIIHLWAEQADKALVPKVSSRNAAHAIYLLCNM